MLRIIPAIDKSVRTYPTTPVIVAAANNEDVLPSVTNTDGEFAGRFIQNTGANSCYFAFGRDCDTTNYNGLLNSGDSVNCTGERVSVYSTLGTTIATIVLRRTGL